MRVNYIVWPLYWTRYLKLNKKRALKVRVKEYTCFMTRSVILMMWVENRYHSHRYVILIFVLLSNYEGIFTWDYFINYSSFLLKRKQLLFDIWKQVSLSISNKNKNERHYFWQYILLQATLCWYTSLFQFTQISLIQTLKRIYSSFISEFINIRNYQQITAYINNKG